MHINSVLHIAFTTAAWISGIKQASVHFENVKSKQVYSLATMELNWKLITDVLKISK